jgi:hypothetical protein
MMPSPADPNVAAALGRLAAIAERQPVPGESAEVRLLREQNELLRAQLAKKTAKNKPEGT